MDGCKKEVQCTNYNIDAAFIGFQKSDLDTIILRKYAPDNNFSQLIDSFILINDTSQLQRNDTIRIAIRRPDASVLMGFGNDWQIFIPSKNRVVSVSDIIASPLAYMIANKWLQNFPYRVTISWWLFASAGLLVVLVALITVSFQSIKAAVANPVKSLRTE